MHNVGNGGVLLLGTETIIGVKDGTAAAGILYLKNILSLVRVASTTFEFRNPPSFMGFDLDVSVNRR